MSSRWPTTTSRNASAPRTAATLYNYQPGRGLDYSSGTAFPGNWSQGRQRQQLADAGGCKGADLIPRNGICRQSLWRYLDLVPGNREDLRCSAAPPASWPTSTTSAWSTSGRATTTLPRSGPGTLTGLQIDPGTAFYPGNGITPVPAAPSSTRAGRWRSTGGRACSGHACNPRRTPASACCSGFDGQFAGWDHDIGASYNQNKVVDAYPQRLRRRSRRRPRHRQRDAEPVRAADRRRPRLPRQPCP